MIENKENAASQNEQFVIPMDAPIEEFGYHLKSHPRTILSAKFGDGKSFFLSKFEEVKKDDYEIITLHPVNYQVVENKDIFELIKRDILFQITVKGMLDENLEINEEVAWIFFIQNNFMGLTESAMSFLSLLQSPPKMVSGVLTALKTHKILKYLREKVLKIKEEYKSTDALEAFFDKCSNISVLEKDWITKTIQDSIDKYKSDNPNKRVVLVIEDMDRLDPAPLFRILNVFSAHLDTNEKNFVKSDGSYFYNKFHFDNVVFVMDYDNTKNIFKHFYGAETNFDGYIEKFVTKGFFGYSLKVEKHKYYIRRITSITKLPKEYVEAVLHPECFEGKSIRFIVNAFENISDHIKRYPIYEDKILHFGILELYAIMKNLGVDGAELVNGYRSVLNEKRINVFEYILPTLFTWWIWFYPFGGNFILCSHIKDASRYSFIQVGGYHQDNNCLQYLEIIKTLDHPELIPLGDFTETINSSTGMGFTPNDLQRLFSENNFENLPKILDRFVA